ncbi:MAG: twin-arginine translocase subunit TatC [Bacteriovoracaceae bacterium]
MRYKIAPMKEMSLTEHLEELRTCFIRVMIILFVSFFIAYGLGEHISNFLLEPLRDSLKSLGPGQEIVYLGLLDKVLSQLQVAFWTSIILSSPFWFYQIWSFLKPGLYEREIKAIKPFLLVGFILFWLGVGFGYFIIFPFTFETLLSFGVKGVNATISLKDYLILASKVLVFLGVIFQLPNLLLILGFMGLVTKYSLRKWRRYVYLGFALSSALITPPDIITMLGVWLPLVVLYELGIWAVAVIVHPFLAKQYA